MARADNRGKKPRMFTPVLLTFAGDTAATRRIAEEIAGTLQEEGLATEILPISAVTDLRGFGTVVVGGEITGGRWAAAARAFLAAHRAALVQLPVAVFAIAPPEETGAPEAHDREELLNELAQMRWLHPIAAGLFRTAARARAGLDQPNGHGPAPNGSVMPNLDEIRRWAQVVAHVLNPAPLR